jgi:hypothetical protein
MAVHNVRYASDNFVLISHHLLTRGFLLNTPCCCFHKSDAHCLAHTTGVQMHNTNVKSTPVLLNASRTACFPRAYLMQLYSRLSLVSTAVNWI